MRGSPLVVGLTGGIGSGKSTVADRFRMLGVPVVDADVIARQLVEPGSEALEEIKAAFGASFLDAAGQLDRALLRKTVFPDTAKRRLLESILHPRVRQRIAARVAGISAPYCIVVIPLLVETGQGDLVDRILVVDTPREMQYRRVALRDGLTPEEISSIVEAQADPAERISAADDIIRNDSDLDNLYEQVRTLHHKYLETAKQRP
jgi:dephospho-CoA kinase